MVSKIEFHKLSHLSFALVDDAAVDHRQRRLQVADAEHLTSHAHKLHVSESTSACRRTNSIASFCLSGGYLYRRKIMRTKLRSFARTLSRTCQSTVVLFLSFSVNSCAIFFSVSSPSSRTADSLLVNAS